MTDTLSDALTTPADALAVYIHWPFCLSKCPYCDFNSHVREIVDHSRWQRALSAEIDYWAAQARGRTVGSIFFGGGTPSLMAPETVATIIDRVGEKWALADDLEITLEANPTSVEAGRFAAFAEAGVNRLSLGIQALDDAALRFLGRQHDAAEAREALDLARRNFSRFSFDLIYARPEQDSNAWRNELSAALDMAGGHLSLYQLTIEKGTPFYSRHRDGEIIPPGETLAGDLFDVTNELTAAAGYLAYEISNYALPGEACRHNLAYWRYADYVGIGPGAHGRLTNAANEARALRQHAKPETWLQAVEEKGHGSAEARALGAGERADEMLMMGLRLQEGVDVARFHERTGLSLEQAVRPGAIQRLSDGGFLRQDDQHLWATARGRAVLDSVLAELLA
jgi:putative oxygen-independent coproporphyrinogen III oxidase